MSQVQRQPRPYKPLIMEKNYSRFACLIWHQALDEGELIDDSPEFEYEGEDEPGLSLAFVDEEEGEVYLFEDL